jgi:parallel beta-helix repeat protein/predicted outer membrane repeat protein
MKNLKIKILLFVLLIVPLAPAAVLYVPTTDYPTIQDAVNACSDFTTDTVIVAPDTYRGSRNRDINFNGKTIILQSTDPADPLIVSKTVIDCEGDGRGFVFKMAENGGSTVAGFTVTKGNGFLGGAIYCSNNSSPLITNCVFINNSAAFGGAIACTNTNTTPKITNCTIKENSASFGGGAIYCNGASPKIANSLIIANSSQNGAAVYTHNAGNPVIENCTISQNTASDSAGGIYCYKSSNLTVNNTILWVQLSYCNVRNPAENIICDAGCFVIWGPGNINIDPNFVDLGSLESDYHLLKDSQCVDAGDPGFIPGSGETDIDGDPRITGAKIDIGADELMLAIPVDIEITPKTLNLQSNGNWINCAISLGDGYDITDVNIPSITLNGNIEPEWSNIDQEEQKLLVKFNRSEIQQMLQDTQEVSATLTVAGKLNDGADFEGEDTIRLVNKKGKN